MTDRSFKNDSGDISYYIRHIEFTASEIEKGSEVIDVLNLTTPMWGLPEIEGRIICIKYKVSCILLKKPLLTIKKI
ncbi:MAG: hypothetical protein ACR5KV_06440 [Wolbachia sp.]